LRIAEDDDVFINFTINGAVENAIKHGIDTKAKSIIDISLEVVQNELFYKVTNTMHQALYGLKDSASGFGLDNLKKRLAILYPKAHTMETKVEKGYFISLLKLQID
jgi:sensor histidine kinase YesM